MTSERWQELDRIYHLALARDVHEREAFLREACGPDPALLADIRSLLDHADAAEVFLERTALEQAAAADASACASLVGRQIGGYEVLAFLGAGGMGEVYRARDVRLGRDVALKVIVGAPFADAAFVARFEEEARSASVLSHASIVTIYGVGEADDVSYIAMEIVEGRTLRERLGDGPMPVMQALDVASQLADALAAAHGAGVDHRDLKPENVMVTPGGLVKVLDFGIAKRDGGPEIEWPGVPGTIGYMSPERIRGETTDHRADQFAFGVMCYEMLAGRHPFAADAPASTQRAILEAQPARLQGSREMGLHASRAWLERCLAKDPAARFADTRELAREVHTTRERWRRAQQPPAITRRRMLALTAAGAAAAAAGIAAWNPWADPKRPRSIAIPPFVNTSGDPALDYVCDGLADGLIQRLWRLSSLAVGARSAAANFRGPDVDLASAAATLGVEAIVRGAVTLVRGQLRVEAELFDAAAGKATWRREATVAFDSWFLAQTDLAIGLVEDGLALRLSRDERRRVAQPLTMDEQANDLYVRAMYFHRLNTEAGYITARDLLEQAVARDPQFSRAFAALASTFTVSAIDGYMRPVEAWSQSIRHVDRALRLEPDLPDAHAERAASSFFFMWDWDGSEQEWALATDAGAGEINPDLFIGHALNRWALGDSDEALRLAERARQIDPVSPVYAIRCADLLAAMGRFREAETAYERVAASARDARVYFGLAEVLRRQGRVSDAVASLRRGFTATGQQEVADTRAGSSDVETYRAIERAGALRQLTEMEARARSGAYVSPFDFARVHARLGDTARAFAFFDRAFEDHSPDLVFLNVDPVWASMRDDARFKTAVERVGLRA